LAACLLGRAAEEGARDDEGAVLRPHVERAAETISRGRPAKPRRRSSKGKAAFFTDVTKRSGVVMPKAMVFDPDHPDAHFSRGFLAFYQDRLDTAADDFATVYAAAQGALKDYALIWRYLSEVRGGADMVRSMTAFEGRDNSEAWPGILVSLFSGAVLARDVLIAARHDNPKRQRDREAIANFFIGQLFLIKGDQLGAMEFFRKAIATGAVNIRQYGAAKIELKRLQAR